jgi:hypothetical protein
MYRYGRVIDDARDTIGYLPNRAALPREEEEGHAADIQTESS